MNDGIKMFFAFMTLAVISIIIIKMLTNSQGTTALSNSIFGGFNGILKTIAGA